MSITSYTIAKDDSFVIEYELTVMDNKFRVGKQTITAIDGTVRIEHSEEEFSDLKQTANHIKKTETIFRELQLLAIKNDGGLSTEQITRYFNKMLFKDKLRGKN